MVLLLLIFLAGGFDAPASTPYYFTRPWQTEDGVPGNNVTAVVQTQDGYLWVGTRSGLARFDGMHFTPFNSRNAPQMRSSHVTSLFEAADGTLWIGHEDGELTAYQAGKFRAVPVKAAWGGGKIFAIGADKQGDIWLLNQAGELARLKDGFVIPAPPTTARLLVMASNPRGGLWIQRDGEVASLENGRLKPVPFEGTLTNRYVQGIGAARDGSLWVTTQSRLLKWDDERWTDLGPAPWEWAPAHMLYEMRNGTIAAATADHGLFLVVAGEETLQFCRTNGFSTDWITSVCEDREGNLWVGTGNGGLAQLRAVNFRVLGPPDQWQGRAVLSVATGRDGAMWIGTEGAGLYRFQEGNWDNFEWGAGISNRYVWSVSPDTNDRIWAGTWGGGLFVQDGTRFSGAPGLGDFAEPVAALLASAGGKMWLGTRVGLMQFESGRMTWLGRAPELFSPDVRAVREGPDGAIWFGMAGGGLGRFKQGTLKQFRITDGLSSDFVQCLRFDDDGALWIGTLGGGLNRLKDGHFAKIGTRQGLPHDAICDIEDDGRSNFWFSSHGGIFRVSKDNLNGCADGTFPQVRCLIYGKGDGLPTLECSGGFQPAGCKTPDGRLWFPTSKGLVAVSPNEVNVNRLEPPVVIEEVLVDGQPVALAAAGGGRLRIPPGRSRIEFHYTGLSFVVPEKVRFQYRLEGLDLGWVDAADDGTKRAVDFSYLRPGDYTFHVRACNNDEVWNETGVAVAFTMLPHFWQTWWFRAFTGVLAMAAVAGAVWFNLQRRMHRKLERLERQRAIERERERIAKDIHDDLGASLTRITMLSQSAQGNLNNPQAAAVNLNRIYGTARELTRAMDEIVWAVNPKHDTLDSLASYLGKFAQDFLRAAGVRCRLDVPVQLPAWPLTAEVRHNLFLAVKEALHNIVKHASATEVLMSLALEPRVFVFTVQDNGNGFVEQQPPAGLSSDPGRIVHGYGLANMRRRLAEIGGRCEIESPPGQGTKVKFTVPAQLQPVRSGWRGSDGVS